MNPATARCRLCYDLKPYDQLLDLKNNEDQKKKIVGKLQFLKLKNNGLASAEDDGLPKTVCSECTYLVDESYKFTVIAENAQKQLRFMLCSFAPECAATPRE